MMYKEKDRIVGHLLENCSFRSYFPGLELPAHRPPNLSETGQLPVRADTCVILDTRPLFLKLFETQKVFPIRIMTFTMARFLDKITELGEKRKTEHM